MLIGMLPLVSLSAEELGFGDAADGVSDEPVEQDEVDVEGRSPLG